MSRHTSCSTANEPPHHNVHAQPNMMPTYIHKVYALLIATAISTATLSAQQTTPAAAVPATIPPEPAVVPGAFPPGPAAVPGASPPGPAASPPGPAAVLVVEQGRCGRRLLSRYVWDHFGFVRTQVLDTLTSTP